MRKRGSSGEDSGLPAGVTATRWQTIWEWPLTVAAVVFLIVYAWQVLGELQGPASHAADVILTITWVMFAIDYVARLVLAQRRWSWFGRHLLDLAIVALPILRPLRLVRLVVLLAIFQRVAGRTLRGRVVVYVAGSTILLVFVTALAVLDAERHEPGASIQTFGDALWWAFAHHHHRRVRRRHTDIAYRPGHRGGPDDRRDRPARNRHGDAGLVDRSARRRRGRGQPGLDPQTGRNAHPEIGADAAPPGVGSATRETPATQRSTGHTTSSLRAESLTDP